jgi:putative lipoic acid-binding regulatory protein
LAEDDPVERARALLAAHHEFPGPFEFRVVVRPVHRSAAVAAVVRAAGGDEVLLSVDERASSNGTYVALRIAVHVHTVDHVLAVYQEVKLVEGVLTVL